MPSTAIYGQCTALHRGAAATRSKKLCLLPLPRLVSHLNDRQPVTKASLQQRDQARHKEDGLDDLHAAIRFAQFQDVTPAANKALRRACKLSETHPCRVAGCITFAKSPAVPPMAGTSRNGMSTCSMQVRPLLRPQRLLEPQLHTANRQGHFAHDQNAPSIPAW